MTSKHDHVTGCRTVRRYASKAAEGFYCIVVSPPWMRYYLIYSTTARGDLPRSKKHGQTRCGSLLPSKSSLVRNLYSNRILYRKYTTLPHVAQNDHYLSARQLVSETFVQLGKILVNSKWIKGSPFLSFPLGALSDSLSALQTPGDPNFTLRPPFR
jgi:hypothetical protein